MSYIRNLRSTPFAILNFMKFQVALSYCKGVFSRAPSEEPEPFWWLLQKAPSEELEPFWWLLQNGSDSTIFSLKKDSK